MVGVVVVVEEADHFRKLCGAYSELCSLMVSSINVTRRVGLTNVFIKACISILTVDDPIVFRKIVSRAKQLTQLFTFIIKTCL